MYSMYFCIVDVVSVYLYSTARYAGASSSEDPLASIPKRFWIPKHPCVLGPGPWAKYFVAALRFKPGKRGEEPPELAAAIRPYAAACQPLPCLDASETGDVLLHPYLAGPDAQAPPSAAAAAVGAAGSAVRGDPASAPTAGQRAIPPTTGSADEATWPAGSAVAPANAAAGERAKAALGPLRAKVLAEMAGFVAALATIVLPSSALVRRNLRLPLAAVAIGSLLNAAGDWWLVLRCGMGVRGAAWATVAAQVAACGVLARAASRGRSRERGRSNTPQVHPPLNLNP